jgi:hypothetical protein
MTKNDDKQTLSDANWTVPQLHTLLSFKFPNDVRRGVVDFTFLLDGMTPGDVVSFKFPNDVRRGVSP